MLERLNNAFAAQRQFTGNAAHELRTPLALMQAQLELFSSGFMFECMAEVCSQSNRCRLSERIFPF